MRLLLVLVFIAVCPPVFAGTVKKLLPKNSAVTVEVDSSESFEKGSKVCFMDLSGKKVGCGKVVKVASTKVYVRLSKTTFEKIQVGFTTEGSSGGGTASASSSTSSTKNTPFAIRGKWAPHVFSPVVFSTATYNAPSSSTPNPTLNTWKSDLPITSNLMVFAFEVQIPVGSKAITPGFRYKKVSKITVLSDYTTNDTSTYLENVHDASAIGFWTDFVYKYIPLTSSISMPLTAGLDFESSSLSFVSTKKNDTTGTSSDFVSAKSSLMAISLRFGLGFDFKFSGSVGGSASATALLPLTAMNKSFAVTDNDTIDAKNPDREANIQAALAHKLNKFGLETGLGLLISF